jgi:hypothetical protein
MDAHRLGRRDRVVVIFEPSGKRLEKCSGFPINSPEPHERQAKLFGLPTRIKAR